MRKNIEIIQKVFQIRNCKDVNFRNRSRPCIEHQIGKCSAPCVGLISEKEYKENVDEAKNFLDGKNKSILKTFIKKWMIIPIVKTMKEQNCIETK